MVGRVAIGTIAPSALCCKINSSLGILFWFLKFIKTVT